MGWLVSKVSEYAATLAEWGLNYTSVDDALARLSQSHFSNTKVGATPTIGKMTFTVEAGEGPHSVGLSEVIVKIGNTRYVNTEARTLTDAGSVLLTMESETAGADTTAAINSECELVTTLSGVTVTNPPISGSNDWQTQPGEDDESNTVLRERNSTKWSTLGNGEVVIDRVTNLCLNASSAIKKVAHDDDNPRGAGTADVYIGGDNVAVADEDVEAAQLAMDQNFFNNVQLGSAERVQVNKTTLVELTLVGIVYYDTNYTSAQVQANVEAAIAVFTRTVPIGGFRYASGFENVVTTGDIRQAIENAIGVLTATLTTPASNVSLAFNEQIVPPAAFGLTYTGASQDYYGS